MRRPLTRATGARGLLTTLEAAPYTPYAPYTPVRPLHPLTGARGLLTILEAALRPYNFELPSHAVRSLEVDAQMIREPQAQLERLLERLELGTKE